MTTEPERSLHLLLPGQFDVRRWVVALAAATGVPVDEVDVAPRGVMERNWESTVLCTFEPAAGDIVWILDLYFSERLGSPPGRDKLAATLAQETGEPVLYEAEPFSPTSYWLAAPGGWRTRARVEDVDGAEDDDRPALALLAVQRAVPALPGVPVDPMPEVIRDLQMATPVSDEWGVSAESALARPAIVGDPVWFAHTRLGAWEQLTVRMVSGWPPDGWYPLDYYLDDLATRDELAGVAATLPAVVAERFTNALATIDGAFRGATRDADVTAGARTGGARTGGGWWWGRSPDPEPWPFTGRTAEGGAY